MPDPAAPTPTATPAPTEPTLAQQITTPVEVPVIAPAATPIVKEVKIEDIGGIKGPKDLLGDDTDAQIEAINKATPGEKQPARDPKTGKFAKPGEPAAPAQPKSAAAKPAQPAAAKKPAATPPAAQQPPAKVKIGDKEMTPGEIAARFAELEKKAAPAQPPAEPAKPGAPQQTEAERIKELDTKFIEQAVAKFTAEQLGITAESLDKILAGGDEAVQAHVSSIAKAMAMTELSARKFAAAEINAMKRHLQPVLRQQALVSQYETERAFLDENPDIREHPKGLETAREKADALTNYYDGLLAKARAGTATEQEKAWATIYAKLTPEEFTHDIAHHTRLALSLATHVSGQPPTNGAPKPATPAPAAVATPPPAKPAAPPMRPFDGDRPGGHAAPALVSKEARLLADLNAHEGI